jgi:multidrug efflux pump subunit AcrA (membrane-fusion protein)
MRHSYKQFFTKIHLGTTRFFGFLSKRRVLFIILGVLLVAGAIFLITRNKDESMQTSDAQSALLVVEKVEKGDVVAGISASGKVVARQKLNLNIYRQQHRIDHVGISNGSTVSKGQLLFSFDDDDIQVKKKEAQVVLGQAQLDLDEKETVINDPNTEINSLESSIALLEKQLVDDELGFERALRKLYSADLEFRPASGSENGLSAKSAPVVSGTYNGAKPGTYTMEIYPASGSGFAYKLSGLETTSDQVFVGKTYAMGKLGLKVSFGSDVAAGDTWVLEIPNKKASNYVSNKETYDDTVRTLTSNIATKNVDLANKRQQLDALKRKDNSSYKNLDVRKTELSLNQAQLDIRSATQQQTERRVIAPFSGTVEGIENIVVGATPTGLDNDSMNFGTLISNEFIASFSLDAANVARVKLGQEVLVTISGALPTDPLPAKIISISSLPESDSVPKYTVEALIDATALKASGTILREGKYCSN